MSSILELSHLSINSKITNLISWRRNCKENLNHFNLTVANDLDGTQLWYCERGWNSYPSPIRPRYDNKFCLQINDKVVTKLPHDEVAAAIRDGCKPRPENNDNEEDGKKSEDQEEEGKTVRDLK